MRYEFSQLCKMWKRDAQEGPLLSALRSSGGGASRSACAANQHQRSGGRCRGRVAARRFPLPPAHRGSSGGSRRQSAQRIARKTARRAARRTTRWTRGRAPLCRTRFGRAAFGGSKWSGGLVTGAGRRGQDRSLSARASLHRGADSARGGFGLSAGLAGHWLDVGGEIFNGEDK